VRAGRVLMVRERGRGPEGRHDGLEYWTLPGGGIDDGETPAEALAREVEEEVGLTCMHVSYLYDFPFPSGRTACYAVDVPADQEPALGVDPDLRCGCPRMVGLDWIALPDILSEGPAIPVPMMLLATPIQRLSQ
jgi:8-oxo-dGTP diphosphatase